jgi:hypothetical protein
VKAGSEEVVEIVVTDNVSSPCPIATCMKRSGITGFLADAIYFVELDQMLVAPQGNGLMRCVVDEIVLDTLSNSFEKQSILSRSHPRTVVMDVIVYCEIFGGHKSLSIPTPQAYTTKGKFIKIAALNAVIDPTVDDHGIAPEETKCASGNKIVTSPGHRDTL